MEAGLPNPRIKLRLHQNPARPRVSEVSHESSLTLSCSTSQQSHNDQKSVIKGQKECDCGMHLVNLWIAFYLFSSLFSRKIFRIVPAFGCIRFWRKVPPSSIPFSSISAFDCSNFCCRNLSTLHWCFYWPSATKADGIQLKLLDENVKSCPRITVAASQGCWLSY